MLHFYSHAPGISNSEIQDAIKVILVTIVIPTILQQTLATVDKAIGVVGDEQ